MHNLLYLVVRHSGMDLLLLVLGLSLVLVPLPLEVVPKCLCLYGFLFLC